MIRSDLHEEPTISFKRNQMQSDAIRCSKRQSDATRSNHLHEGGADRLVGEDELIPVARAGSGERSSRGHEARQAREAAAVLWACESILGGREIGLWASEAHEMAAVIEQ